VCVCVTVSNVSGFVVIGGGYRIRIIELLFIELYIYSFSKKIFAII